MNIYQIQEELLNAYDELEENGGELTPELEEKLTITQEEFKTKIKDYTSLIKSLESDIKECKEEQERLKKYRNRKEKLHDKLEEILIKAINDFGDEKKTGVRYIDYGTGEASIHKSTAADVNEPLVEDIGKYVERVVTFNKECNQLDVYDRFDQETSIKELSKVTGYKITDSDLNCVDLSLEVNVPIKDLFNGAGYSVLREIAKYSAQYKLSAEVSKSYVKPILQQNGSAFPNIAKLKTNESLTIK